MCRVAGCIYSALFKVKRPGHDEPVEVCRKCCADLTTIYKWEYVGPLNP